METHKIVRNFQKQQVISKINFQGNIHVTIKEPSLGLNFTYFALHGPVFCLQIRFFQLLNTPPRLLLSSFVGWKLLLLAIQAYRKTEPSTNYKKCDICCGFHNCGELIWWNEHLHRLYLLVNIHSSCLIVIVVVVISSEIILFIALLSLWRFRLFLLAISNKIIVSE